MMTFVLVDWVKPIADQDVFVVYAPAHVMARQTM